jgi:tetratricopeptide (TPR) repeat protein
MKTRKVTMMITLIILTVSHFALAHDDKYTEAMQKQIANVYNAQSQEDLQEAVNAFERIADAEPKKWEPLYYAAFGYIMMANRQKETAKKDDYLDRAIVAIEKAKALVPQESEVIALEGFAHMIRVTVDPGTRGPQYAGRAMQAFGAANAINPENPRPLALMAQMQYGTAKFFNSPPTEACETLKRSLEKFETYKSENPLAPKWGKSMAEGMKEQCR